MIKHDEHLRTQAKCISTFLDCAKKNKTRFFYVLYSDKNGFLTNQSARRVLSML